MLHARGFSVDFPGQIPNTHVEQAFPWRLSIPSIDLVNNLVTKNPTLKPNLMHVSHYTPLQRDLIYVTNMCYLGLIRGEVYLPGETPMLTPLPFSQKLTESMHESTLKQPSLAGAMIEASRSTIRDFDEFYPVLTGVLEQQLEDIGASGMARAIILSTEEARKLHKSRFQSVNRTVAIVPSDGLFECLGPHIARQMMKDASSAVAELRGIGVSPDMTVQTQPEIAEEILKAFSEIRLAEIRSRYSRGTI